MIYEMSFAYNASFRLNREISFCMFAKISAGQIKFGSIRSHRQQTNLFRKSNHELLHCTHPRHLHRLLCCFCILFSSSSSLLLSFTAAACFTKARFRWLHPERHCAAFVMSPWQFVTLLQTSNWVMFMQMLVAGQKFSYHV